MMGMLPSFTGGGGLIQNENGDWIAEYATSLGVTSRVMSELWVLKDGLILATQLKTNSLCAELDAELIVLLPTIILCSMIEGFC